MYIPIITITIIVVKIIMKFSDSSGGGPKEYSISSELEVSDEVLRAVDLFPGKDLMLVNKPGTPEVLVRVKADDERFLELGTIENRELTAKVIQGKAKAKVMFVTPRSVKVELSYS